MEKISTIGLDIAKNVFQVHAIDETGKIVVQRRLKRRQVLSFFEKHPHCLISLEACATSHCWARQIDPKATSAKNSGNVVSHGDIT